MIIVGLTAYFHWELEKMDVLTTFVHGYLHKEIYMRLPVSFYKLGNKNKAYSLRCSLHGLKKYPTEWNERFHNFITSINVKIIHLFSSLISMIISCFP